MYGWMGCVSNNSRALVVYPHTCTQHVLHTCGISLTSELTSRSLPLSLSHTHTHRSCRKQGLQCEPLHMWCVLAVTFPTGVRQLSSPTAVSCHYSAKLHFTVTGWLLLSLIISVKVHQQVDINLSAIFGIFSHIGWEIARYVKIHLPASSRW